MLIATLLSIVSYAQTTINATIKSKEDKEPLIGVVITNLATNISTMTDENGAFNLPISNSYQKIKIAYYGYQEKELLAKNIAKVVFLESKLESLN